jgi:hypothetical protein
VFELAVREGVDFSQSKRWQGPKSFLQELSLQEICFYKCFFLCKGFTELDKTFLQHLGQDRSFDKAVFLAKGCCFIAFSKCTCVCPLRVSCVRAVDVFLFSVPVCVSYLRGWAAFTRVYVVYVCTPACVLLRVVGG